MRKHHLILAIAGVVALMCGGAAIDGASADEAPVAGFDRKSYESAMAFNERTTTPSAWMSQARSDVEAAMARWDRDAAFLYDSPDALAEARSRLRAWSDDDIAARFASWLMDRFFGREAARVRGFLESATASANRRLLYQVAPDGSIVRDDAGDPVYARADGIDGDTVAWRSAAAEGLSSALNEYDARIESLYPELLAAIAPADRERYASIIAGSISASRGRAAVELDALAEREERLFVARRTTDVWSLRRKSEDEAAAAIAAELARDAASACESGFADLNARIESAATDAQGLELAGQSWLAAFKEQFDRGLHAWKSAEERFVVRRLEWERDAATAYDAGNEAWASAFERLAVARQAWEDRAGQLYREGEAAFSGASASLEASIRSARAEFERLAVERTAMSADRANAWVDVYVQAGQSMSCEYESASYWLSELGSDTPRLGDPALAAWLETERQRPENDATRRTALESAASSLDRYDRYRQQAAQAQETLMADLGALLGSGGPLDVLADGVDRDGLHLDPYQIELVRAGAVAAYWQRRADIASAVLAYAQDKSSGRATEAELVASLTEASGAYDSAVASYDAALSALTGSGEATSQARASCDAARVALAAAGARLEEVNTRYASLLSVLLTDDAGSLRADLVARYQNLIAPAGTATDSGAPTQAEAFADYLCAANRLGKASAAAEASDGLRWAVLGSAAEPPLAELRRRVDSIAVPGIDADPAIDPAVYGLEPTDPAYAQIASLQGEFMTRLAAVSGADEAATLRSRYAAIIAALVASVRDRAEAELQQRLDAVALLGSPTMAAWYQDRAGRPLTADGASVLAADVHSASRSLVIARASLELAALDAASGAQPAANQTVADLASWWTGDEADEANARQSLAAILACDRDEQPDQDFASELERLASADPGVGTFIGGQGFFFDASLGASGLDRASLYCASQTLALRRASGRLAAYTACRDSAIAAESERYEAATAALDAGLLALGLRRQDDGSLPGIEALGRAVFDSGGAAAGADASVVAIARAVDAAAAAAPSWVAENLCAWQQSVSAYLAALALSRREPPPVASSELAATLERNRAASAELEDILRTASDEGADARARLSLLADERGRALLVEASGLRAMLSFSLEYERLRDQSAAAVASSTMQWRQYLALPTVLEATGAMGSDSPAPASSWLEGCLADLAEAAADRSAALRSAFATWGSTLAADDPDALRLYVITQKYMENPEASFDQNDAWEAEPELFSRRDALYASYAGIGIRRSQDRSAFASAAAAFDIASDRGALRDRVGLAAGDIAVARAAYDGAMADYASTGAVLAAAGASYDEAYTRASSLDATRETARARYERLDAVRRWASTSYLAVDEPGDGPGDGPGSGYRGPTAELVYAQQGLARANAALAALRGLYQDGDDGEAYGDQEFRSLYEQYRAGYSRMMLVAKARDVLGYALQDERATNASAWEAYRGALATLETGRPSEAWYPYLAIDAGGMLRLAHDDSGVVAGAATSDAIEAYLSDSLDQTIEGLSAWMSATGFDEGRARTWGLARDHIVSAMASSSAGFASLVSTPASAVDDSLLGGHRFTLLGQPLSEILTDYRSGQLGLERKAAYEQMHGDERRWFETYLALQVVGAMKRPVGADGSGAETFDAFSNWSTRAEYQRLESVAASELRVCEIGTKTSAASYAGFIAAAAVAGAFFVTAWLVPGLLAAAGVAYAAIIGFSLSASDINATRSVYAASMNDVQRQTSLNVALMTAGMRELASAHTAYTESCDRLARLSAEGDQTQPVTGAIIADALRRTGRMGGQDAAAVADLYAQFCAATGVEYTRADEALAGLSDWTRARNQEALLATDDHYALDAAAASAAQDRYRAVYTAYLSGQASTNDLQAAIAAFGPEALSVRRYQELIGSAVADIGLSGDPDSGPIPAAEHAQAAASLAELIRKASADKSESELAAREAEWDVRRSELAAKLASWREAAGLIIARGRADFSQGAAAMRDRRDAWARAFADTYSSRQAAWDLTYADMQTEKLAWVAAATDAADNASRGAMLAMVGSDAESSARRFDACTIGELRPDTGADQALRQTIAMAGIGGMAEAIAAQSGSVGTVSVAVRRGLATGGSADSGRIQVAARAFVDKANAELAGTQARIMAARARLSAQGALVALAGNVGRANADFAGTINNRFVAIGKWQRQDGLYVKDVVVHSTFFENFITEKASVASYQWFTPRSEPLKTDLSDATLAVLDPSGIQNLLYAAQREIAARHDEIFGDASTASAAASNGGAFGAWIGRDPRLADNADPEVWSEAMFADQGSGELGRLMRVYLLWSLKEGKGWMEANKPSYDKSLWDDRGDWFKAPSIRGVADMGLAVAASVLSGGTALPALLGAAAINLADDAVFDAIDVAGGYRSAQEAGLSFLKKSAMAGVSVAGGGVFNGFGQNAPGFFGSGLSGMVAGQSGVAEAIGRTTLLGLQSASVGAANAAIGAVSWDGSGLSWSGAAFSSGLQGSLVSAAAGMTGSLTRGLMNQGLEGFTGAVYDHGVALSALGGGIAGQGVQYALTGSAVLNLANVDMFGLAGLNGAPVSMGLLELQLGRSGPSVGFGSDGADTSLGALGRAAMGLEAWAVNARLAVSGQEEATKYTSALRTLYSAGDASSAGRDLFSRIVSGRTNIVSDYSGDYAAQTTFDAATGLSTIRLGQGSLVDTSRFGLSILLAHESYRDGIDNGFVDQRFETDRAVLGHIGVAAQLAASYGDDALSPAQRSEVDAMRLAYAGKDAGSAAALGAVLDRYDSGEDFWKLKNDGSLAFDGFATLRDEDGNIIRSAASMGLSENQIEGGLLSILGVQKSDAAAVEAVRRMMVDAGMQHSFSYDSDQWMWARQQSVAVGSSGSFPVTQSIDLNAANQDKSISLASIGAFYDSLGAGKKMVQGFIGSTYGSAIGLLEYAGDSYKEQAERILARVYTKNEVKMIEANKDWYDKSMRDGIAVDKMIQGAASRSTEFGVDTGNLELATSSVPGAAFFQEYHTGVDYGRGGSSVQTPGGAWQFEWQDDHRGYFQLFGGDLRMRVMHIDPHQLKKLVPGQIIGTGSRRETLFKYPEESYGTGTAAHVHVDFTRRLPYDGSYQRQFIDPLNMKPGNRLDYSFCYMDKLGVPLPEYPRNFVRY